MGAARVAARSRVNPVDDHWPTPSGKRVELASGVCHYREAGDGRPTIVLLHGLATDSRIYGRLQLLLAETAHTVAPDLLGWGFSEPNEGLAFSFDTVDRTVAQFIEARGLEDVVLVGHEMSGPAAIRWAAANPGRTRGLVLLNTYYGWNSARMPPVLKVLHAPVVGGVLQLAIGALRTALFDPLYRWQMGRVWAAQTPMSDALTRTLCETISTSAFARRALHRINDELPAQINANQRRLDMLAQLQCRTLIVWGGRDPYLGPHVARQFRRLIPNSELHLIHDVGHYVQAEAAEDVAGAIGAFVERCRGEG